MPELKSQPGEITVKFYTKKFGEYLKSHESFEAVFNSVYAAKMYADLMVDNLNILSAEVLDGGLTVAKFGGEFECPICKDYRPIDRRRYKPCDKHKFCPQCLVKGLKIPILLESWALKDYGCCKACSASLARFS